MESEWSRNWEASNREYVKRNPEVERVTERRRVDRGYIYETRLKSGDFAVRYYVNGAIFREGIYKKGAESKKVYYALRDALVPSRGGTIKPKASTIDGILNSKKVEAKKKKALD